MNERVCFWLRLSAKQLRQLGDVHRNAPRLIARQQFAGGSSAGLVLAINEGKCLPIVVADNEARLKSLRRSMAAESGASLAAWHALELQHDPQRGRYLGGILLALSRYARRRRA